MATPVGLAEVTQDDFSAGSVLSVARHLIDGRGARDVHDGLYDDDGSIYRRGGSQYQSNAAFGASLRWVYDAAFAAGQRTVFASPAAFGVLAADDVTPVSLGGAGLTEPPAGCALVGGILFIGGGVMYAGSQKAADYSTGTVTFTQGSKVVTGAGTLWLANADAGMLIRNTGGTGYYVVASVDSNTQITLTEAYRTATGAAPGYTLTRLGSFASHQDNAVGTPGPVAPFATAPIFATVGDRLVACSGNVVAFSDSVNQGSAAFPALAGAFQTHSWPVRNQHVLPDGPVIVGAAGLRDRLLLFTTAGVWMISNLALEIIDRSGNPQHRVEQLASDLVCWGGASVTATGNALIVACTDGVYVVDGVSAPVLLSRSVTPRMVGYVRAGHKPGGAAVYKGHLFLPVIDSGNLVIDNMVCRLDRPIETKKGTIFPWSFNAGHGGNVIAFASRAAVGSQRMPNLMGAARGSDAKVLKLGSFFEPAAAVKNDADATTHVCDWVTRDFETGRGGLFNLVRLLKLWYELVDAGSDDPTIQVYYATGPEQAGVPHWGAVNWNAVNHFDSSLAEFVLLGLAAPESDGRQPYVWGGEQGLNAHTRFIRFRFRTSGPCSSAVFRALTFYARQSGRAVS